MRLGVHKEPIRVVGDYAGARRWRIVKLPHRALEAAVGQALPLSRSAETQGV